MKKSTHITLAMASVFVLVQSTVLAGGDDLILHTSDKWDNCSMQLDPSLSQAAWHQFTQEAGLIAYFRPMSSAKPLGARKFEIVLTQERAPIDDTDPAWNDTFVHPHETHFLYGDVSDKAGVIEDGHYDSAHLLALPLPMIRFGLTDKLDISATGIMVPGANYGFVGMQLQYSLINDAEKNKAVAARVGMMRIVGVDDFTVDAYSLNVVASTDLYGFSAYGDLGTYLMASRVKSDIVSVTNENIFGLAGTVGVSKTLFSHLRVGAEMSISALTMPVFVIGYTR